MIKEKLQLNKQYSVNRNNIYKSIANNLNLKTLHINNGIYKIVQPITDELENFVDYTNSLLKELDPLTASYNTLVKMGAELGIYRQYYSELLLDETSQIVQLKIDTTKVFTQQDVSVLLIKKGDAQSLGTYTVTFLKDVYLEDNDSIIPIKLSLQSNSTLSIEEGTLITITPTSNTNIVTEIQLLFNKSIGLFNLQESVEDFRTKVIKARNSRYFNRNKSIDMALTEVPGLYSIEIDKKENNSFTTIYLYTKKLLTDGFDPLLYPLLTTAFTYSLNKYLEDIYETQIVAATPLNIHLNISNINNYTEDYLKTILNETLTKVDSFSVNDIVSILNSYLDIDLKPNNISMSLKSDSIFEKDLLLNTAEALELPVGRFCYIYSIRKV